MIPRLALVVVFLPVCGVRAGAANCSLNTQNISFPNYSVNVAVSTTTTVTVKLPQWDGLYCRHQCREGGN